MHVWGANEYRRRAVHDVRERAEPRLGGTDTGQAGIQPEARSRDTFSAKHVTCRASETRAEGPRFAPAPGLNYHKHTVSWRKMSLSTYRRPA
jgi:hypothetical protein